MADYRAEALAQAQRAGVDPDLFMALIQQESGWNPGAVSPVGAFGLTQAMPDTARQPGFGVSPLVDTDNPTEQLRFGADYLAAMLDRYEGDTPRALAAYNWGAGNADNWSGNIESLPEETRGYIRNITGMAGVDGGYKPMRGGVNSSQAGLNERARQSSPQRDEWEYTAPPIGAGLHSQIFEGLGGDEAASNRMAGIGQVLGALGQDILAGAF